MVKILLNKDYIYFFQQNVKFQRNFYQEITYSKENINNYIIFFNNIFLGELKVLEDGFYYYFPCEFKGSCISSWILKDIYNKLEELNKEWNDKINNYFNKNEG